MRELTIEALGHRGDGVAGKGTERIFVPGSLPGEKVRGEVSGNRLSWPEILLASPDRVPPPCLHFGACSGCQLQHAGDGFIAGWKTGLVRTALASAGIAAEVRAAGTSPASSRRRAVITLRRTRLGIEAGFQARARKALSAIEGCKVLHPDIEAALPAFRALGSLGLKPRGEARAHVTRTETGLDVDIRKARVLDHRGLTEAGRIAVDHGLARVSWEGETVIQTRMPEIALGQTRLVPPPGAFLQATPQGEDALTRFIERETPGARQIADLFAGCGTFALTLNHRAAIHAVESDAAALDALLRAWRRKGGLKPLSVEQRDLFASPLSPEELSGFDAVIIDPPRAGTVAQAAELARSSVPLVLSVSCNPASFARDARLLVDGGYSMGPVEVVDQFRWSARVELAAAFRR